ncbi:MAG: hypothetical protein HYW50_02785 [Candidatus Diapherotrites archaeon]|nr:hypothetical protein [Candidatus Diapherotrites archaeon]
MARRIKILEQSFEMSLNQENKIFVKFVYSKDFKSVEEFVVSLISIINDRPVEVIRFDCTKKESVNVHKFYNNPPTKHYLEKEKSFDTVNEFIESIKENWVQYRLKYSDKL